MANVNGLPPLSEAQTELMNILWDKANARSPRCSKHSRASGAAWPAILSDHAHAVEDKGWLTHREASGVFYFKPTVTREQSQQKAVAQLLEKTFGGSAEDMVLALLDGRKLDEAQLDRITRKLISEAKRSRKR